MTHFNTKYEHTQEDIDFICDPKNTAKEISEKFGCGIATPNRWRSRYGANVGRGSKKGKPKDNRKTGWPSTCRLEGCENEVWCTPHKPEKYCSRDCMYSCEHYSSHLKKKRKPHEKPGLRKHDKTSWVSYRNKVHKLSDKVYEENRHIINPNDHPRTLAGVEGGWQLDHIIEVRWGFDNNIPVEVLCEVENLRMLPWKKNLERNRSTNLT